MSEAKSYEGGCHCGEVRYRVADLDLSRPVISCNCSMCGRSGALLAFVPAASFTLVSGEGSLTDYQFNKHVIHHLFCKVCGIKDPRRNNSRISGVEAPRSQGATTEDTNVSEGGATQRAGMDRRPKCVSCFGAGPESFARGRGPHGEMAAINVRCLDGVELDGLTIQPFDGRSA